MKQDELRQLLIKLSVGDLVNGAPIYDHPCSVAIREIEKLNGNLAEALANEAALVKLYNKLQSDLKASQADCKRAEGERDVLMELIYKFSALESLIPPTKGDEK